MSRFRSVVLSSALVLTALSPRLAAAQQPLTFGVWERFEWFDGVGPTDGLGFSFQSLLQTRIRVTDAFFAGDAFNVFVNGSLFAQTPGVAATGGNADIDTGDEAWAEPSLSKVDFVLSPGIYTITLGVRQDAGFMTGEGFLRADEVRTPIDTVVPEPATVALMATGLAGVALVARRRTAAA
jgi:hypothetical protein